MTRSDRTIRGIDLELMKEITHYCIDTGRTQGDIINEAMMLWLETKRNNKKKVKK